MLNAYATNQTIAAASLVPFTSVSMVKGSSVVLSGSTSIQINRAGVYSVEAVVSGTPDAAGTVTVAMTKNGVAQPQASASVTPVLTTTGVLLNISTIVQVSENNSACCCKSPTVLQFQNTGVGLDAANTSVVVTRIC